MFEGLRRDYVTRENAWNCVTDAYEFSVGARIARLKMIYINISVFEEIPYEIYTAKFITASSRDTLHPGKTPTYSLFL